VKILSFFRAGNKAEPMSVRVISCRPRSLADMHTRSRPTLADDASALAANLSHEAVRFRFLTGTWPTTDEMTSIGRLHQQQVAVRSRPLVDVVHLLLGIADRRAGDRRTS
jgi:hypothetical protein